MHTRPVRCPAVPALVMAMALAAALAMAVAAALAVDGKAEPSEGQPKAEPKNDKTEPKAKAKTEPKAKAEPKAEPKAKADPKEKAEPKGDLTPKEGFTSAIATSFEKAPRLLTLSRVAVKQKPDISVQGDEGAVSLLGNDLKFKVAKTPQGHLLALDANGDGKLTGGEAVRIEPKGGSATFEVRSGNLRTAVTLCEISVGTDAKKNITGFNARVTPGGCMKAEYGGVAIRLIDDNLDGRFTQDGRDAVAFGGSIVGVPLCKQHLITDKHFELDVAEDGSKLALKPLSELPLAQVTTPFPAGSLKCLILMGKGGAYDISQPKTAIPAGDYRMVYGAMSSEGRTLFMYPPVRHGKLLSYKIEADMVNKLRIGPPFKAEFEMGVNAQNALTVKPGVTIRGSGGEEYGPMDLGGIVPMVQVGAGERTLASGSLKGEYACRLPANVDNGWVKVGLRVPGLGSAVGIKDLDGKDISKDANLPSVLNKNTEAALAADQKAAKEAAKEAAKTEKKDGKAKAERDPLLDLGVGDGKLERDKRK